MLWGHFLSEIFLKQILFFLVTVEKTQNYSGKRWGVYLFLQRRRICGKQALTARLTKLFWGLRLTVLWASPVGLKKKRASMGIGTIIVFSSLVVVLTTTALTPLLGVTLQIHDLSITDEAVATNFLAIRSATFASLAFLLSIIYGTNAPCHPSHRCWPFVIF